jgi:hypothetical protein
LPEWRSEDPDRALEEAGRRFLAANGPATREDLALWWGMTPAAAGALIKRLGDHAVPVEVAGSPAVMLAGDVELAHDPPPQSVRLLPAFDQYVVGGHVPRRSARRRLS